MTCVLYSGTMGCVQGSGSRSNHRKCFKKSRKMAKKSGKKIFLKRNSAHYCYDLLWLCLGFRLYIKLFKIIIEKKKNHQKVRNK